MGSGLTAGELPPHVAMDQIGAGLKTEDRVVDVDRTGALPFKRGDIEFHHVVS